MRWSMSWVWPCCGRCSPATTPRASGSLIVLAAILAIDAGLWLRDSTVQWYVGSSGVLHGVLAAGTLAPAAPRASRRAGCWPLVLAGKLLYEHFAGPLPFSGSGRVVVNAHLFGVLGGAAAALRAEAAAAAAIIRRVCAPAARHPEECRCRLRSCFPVRARSRSACSARWRGASRSWRPPSPRPPRRCGYDLWQLVSAGPRPSSMPPSARSRRCWPPASPPGGCGSAAAGRRPQVLSGHSLGEFTALVCAQALEFAPAIELVRFRGEVMQEAVPAGSGAMAAILGLEEADVEAACREAAQGAGGGAGQLQLPGPGRHRRRCGRGAARDRGRQGARRQARGAAAGERALALEPDAGGRGAAARAPRRARACARPPSAT